MRYVGSVLAALVVAAAAVIAVVAINAADDRPPTLEEQIENCLDADGEAIVVRTDDVVLSFTCTYGVQGG